MPVWSIGDIFNFLLKYWKSMLLMINFKLTLDLAKLISKPKIIIIQCSSSLLCFQNQKILAYDLFSNLDKLLYYKCLIKVTLNQWKFHFHCDLNCGMMDRRKWCSFSLRGRSSSTDYKRNYKNKQSKSFQKKSET